MGSPCPPLDTQRPGAHTADISRRLGERVKSAPNRIFTENQEGKCDCARRRPWPKRGLPQSPRDHTRRQVGDCVSGSSYDAFVPRLTRSLEGVLGERDLGPGDPHFNGGQGGAATPETRHDVAPGPLLLTHEHTFPTSISTRGKGAPTAADRSAGRGGSLSDAKPPRRREMRRK
jgi:hypothetical protein